MISSKIFELMQIKESKNLIRAREAEIGSPALSNVEYLECINNVVKNECLNNERLQRYEPKYYFVAIASFLYTPRSWMGESFKLGLRDRIASILGCTPSYVSNIFRYVTDWFAIYKDFREGVEYLYGKISSELVCKKLV